MNILIIDDCECLNLFCCTFLSESGHKTISATTTNFNQIKEIQYNIDIVIVNVDPYNSEEIFSIHEKISKIHQSAYFIALLLDINNNLASRLINIGFGIISIPFSGNELLQAIDSIHSNTIDFFNKNQAVKSTLV